MRKSFLTTTVVAVALVAAASQRPKADGPDIPAWAQVGSCLFADNDVPMRIYEVDGTWVRVGKQYDKPSGLRAEWWNLAATPRVVRKLQCD